ncbi:kinase-like protein [Rickenella mellea]|uniref:Kinase-like protein n=1 Tax=Rickenella mellea TaxID=50990 RepID=A0A4Y7Q0G1_9AGAM|nr:kinase-like protein [Rickenella mellea]
MSQPGPSNSKETSLDPQHVAHDLTKIEKSKFPEPETQINSKNLNASAASTTRFNDIPERKTLIMRDEGTEPFHFQLGTCVGYGQFGGVYRALNLHSGQVVAVKSISLGRYSEAEIQQLMREVRAAKKLNHPTIVTYEIMCRENDILNIVQEFAESGSLAQTIKAFGKLSEHLVHGYAVKILEGLDYLHQSGVAHCNLKASNIFCTKNGNIKLSDFGLSLNVRQKFLESTIDVPGAPNWMAPEVIELKGASRESDIWSFACTIIELLTGNPPYSNLRNSMVVMFWVVEDPMPIIPEDCSERLQDFLRICFQKDPTKRPTVEQLSRHDWLRTPSTPLRGNPQGDIPFARRIGQKSASADPPRYQRDIRRRPVIEDLSTSPPVPIAYALGRTKEAVNDASNPQQHKFVLTTFSSKS